MSDTTAATNDRILDLAELLDGIQEQLVLLEKQADAAKTPLEAAKSAQDAAVQALNAAVEGLNAPKLAKFEAEIPAIKEEIRGVLAEGNAKIQAIREQVNALDTNYRQFERSSQDLHLSFLRSQQADIVEFERRADENAEAHDNLNQQIAQVSDWVQAEMAKLFARPSVAPEQVAEAVNAVKEELSAKLETAKREVVASPGLNPRGKYDERQAYARLDVVEVNGSSYISLIDGNKNRPRKKGNIGWMVCAAGAGGGGSADAVLYTAQSLTTEQKAQARSNIGVAGGTGDLVAANNLTDVADAATAFANIKQAATTSATGVVELATDGETGAGKVVQGNDSRLSDARTPTAHNQAIGTITGLGTGVATALAVNVGSAGAPVVNGGALGTPSSGTLTSCTVKVEITLACSDETTAITAGTGKLTFRMPFAMTLTAIPRASMTTAPTGAAAVFDINESGSSILSTKLSIDATEKTSTTAATPAVLSDTSLADDAEMTVDFDQVGSTIAGAGVKITLIGTRT